jgi:hypothetical protein
MKYKSYKQLILDMKNGDNILDIFNSIQSVEL